MPDEHNHSHPEGLQTLSITLEVIDELKSNDGSTVAELQDELKLSKSAIYNHLNTLRDHELVVKEDEDFKLSYMFTLLGEYVRDQSTLYSVAKEPIDELAASVGYTAHLVTAEHHNRIELAVAMGSNAVKRRVSSVYDSLDFHTTASGKAILAFTDDDTRDHIIGKHGVPERTPNTITDRDELAKHLTQVREKGYAVNDEEEIEGLRGVGAPIKAQSGGVKGAISVSAPVGRLSEEQIHADLAEQVQQVANVVQLDLNMSNRTT